MPHHAKLALGGHYRPSLLLILGMVAPVATRLAFRGDKRLTAQDIYDNEQKSKGILAAIPPPAASTSFDPAKCTEKLKAAGHWDDYDWKFADPLAEEVRVIWFHDEPECFKKNKKTGECIPFFELDWLYNELLRFVPVQKKDLLKSYHGQILSDSAVYIFTNMFCSQDTALAVAKALGICGAKAALMHFGDESGSETTMYADDWKYIMRQYYREKTVETYSDRLQVIPLGYTTNFWDDDNDNLRTHPESLKVRGLCSTTSLNHARSL
jgi:hypothetical protein